MFIGSVQPLDLTINNYGDSKFFYPKNSNNDVFIHNSGEAEFTTVDLTILFSRLIGKLTFAIRDTLPDGADSITIERRRVPVNYYFKDRTIPEDDLTYSIKLSGQHPNIAPPLTVYTLPDAENVAFDVTVYDALGTIIMYKPVWGDYAVKSNQELVVSGYLYKSKPQFNTFIDTEWGKTDSLDFFGY